MALIAAALTTLADVKLFLRIPSATTADDSFIENLINQASVMAGDYCQRNFARATYTNEIQAVNNRSFLILRNWPIITVSSILENGVAITDQSTNPDDYAKGMIYREKGWIGRHLVAGLTDDPVAGARIYSVTYTAGYYMPGDVATYPLVPPAVDHYVAGSATSLPLSLSMACTQFVAGQYAISTSGGMGLKAYSEGQVSWTWGDPLAQTNNASGFQAMFAGILNKYKKVCVA